MWGLAFCMWKAHHDCIISLRGKGLAHKTSLTLPLFYWNACSKPGKSWSCIFVLEVLILPLYMIMIFDYLNCTDSVLYFVYPFIYTTIALIFLNRGSLFLYINVLGGIRWQAIQTCNSFMKYLFLNLWWKYINRTNKFHHIHDSTAIILCTSSISCYKKQI
jgi:hypothetical protein